MAKVITFSKYFPAYHYRAGEPTFFPEKFIKAFDCVDEWRDCENFIRKVSDLGIQAWYDLEPKYHTIRGGRRWKVGDMFSPRYWSGKPYRSKQIKIAPDTQIKKIWDIEIWVESNCIYIGIRKDETTHELLSFGEVAKNDGLTFEEMQHWFNVKPDKPFIGQIICWDKNIKY